MVGTNKIGTTQCHIDKAKQMHKILMRNTANEKRSKSKHSIETKKYTRKDK